jgi:hypothetical protein
MGMNTVPGRSPSAVERLRQDYAPLMLRYLTHQDESGRRSAYELGRDAMHRSVGLLEVVRVHHEVLLEVLGSVRDVDEAHSVARAAGDLLIDLLASFEMSQRGFMDLSLGRDQTAEPT